MQKVERSAQARRELDRKFDSADLRSIRARPRSGWIRAIRGALGMSQAVLAKRLGISSAAVNKLEHAELDGGITIAKLAQVAAALDCSLVYALVPNTSLEGTVGAQARKRAARLLGYASRTMALEAQDVAADRQKEALDRYARDLIDSGRLWREEQAPPSSSE